MEENTAMESAEENVARETSVGAEQEPAGQEEAQKEEIPEELSGLPDEIAREAMAEAADSADKAEQEKKEQEETGADAQPEAQAAAKGNIPYGRFKQKVDEANSLKEELERYRQRFGDIGQAKRAQPQRQQTMQPVDMPKQAQEAYTPEIMKMIDEAVLARAMQIAKMSKDDVDSVKYMEDGDPRKMSWQNCLAMARYETMSRVEQARRDYLSRQQQFMEAHNASVADYNEFAMAQTREPDFEAIKEYATNEFFEKTLNPTEQKIVADSYTRIERNVASPQDIMIVKDYFAKAKQAYRNGHPQAKPKPDVQTRAKQASAMPRSQGIEGAGDSSAATVATLEKMLQETPWDEIDPRYQKMLLGM